MKNSISIIQDNSLVWHLYKICFLIISLVSLNAYPFWHVPQFLFPFLFLGFSIIFLFFNRIFFNCSKKSIIVVALLTVILGTRGNINAYIVALLIFFPFCAFILLDDRYKIDLYFFLRAGFAWILGISLIGWCLYLLGLDIPFIPDFYGWSESQNEIKYIYKNHFVFLVNLKSQMVSDFGMRFSSIFLEPGYLGCLCVVFLNIENFRIRKNPPAIVFLLTLLFTLSLAGWLLFAITYFFKILKGNRRYVYLIVFSISAFVLVEFFTFYKGGDNIVNQRIIERLSISEEAGTISGYNRTGESFDEWFYNVFLHSKDIFLGNHERYQVLFGDAPNVGATYYIANYGLLGCFMYLFFLFYIIRKYKSNKNSYIALLLYLLIFIRGNYVIFMFIFLSLYYLSIIYPLYNISMNSSNKR